MRRTRREARDPIVSGPRPDSVINHHLTEAIRHLATAADLLRERSHEGDGALAMSVDRVLYAVRDVRGDVGSRTP